MAVGSKDLVSENLRGLDEDRLVDELRKAKEELFNLRFQAATSAREPRPPSRGQEGHRPDLHRGA
jgi:large subunit ribosomal protein L29